MDLKMLKIIAIFLAFWISALACTFSPRATTAPATDTIATLVAGTVQAVATQVSTKTAQARAAATDISASPTVPAPVRNAAQVVYTDGNNNLWIWEEGGASKQLVNSGNVHEAHISSDRSLIVFTRMEEPNHYSLWVIHSDGRDVHSLISSSEFEAMPSVPEKISEAPAQVQWLPGSHTILFNTRPLFEGPGAMLNNDLWQLNADNGLHTNLLPYKLGGSFVISPDCKQLAIATSDTISLINSDGSNRRSAVLKYTPIMTYSEYAYYVEPIWSNDSKSLRVVIPAPASLENPTQPSTIWNIPLDGSQADKIGSVVTVPLVWAKLSSDVKKILYLGPFGNLSQKQNELYTAWADGSGVSVYQGGQLKPEGWAPDSSHFVFTDQDKKVTYIQQAGSDSAPLANGKAVEKLQWMDASRFIYLIPVDSGWELRMGMIGGDDILIAKLPTGAGNGYPSFESNLNVP